MAKRAEQLQRILSIFVHELTPSTSERGAWELLERLMECEAASHRFSAGAHHLAIAGVRCSCTMGYYALLNRWRDRARAALGAEGAVS